MSVPNPYFWGEPAPPEKPPVWTWYVIYASLMALLYVAVLGAGLFMVVSAAGRTEDMVLAVVMAAVSAPFAIAFGVAPFLPKRPWAWYYHLALIALGMTSACCMLASIPFSSSGSKTRPRPCSVAYEVDSMPVPIHIVDAFSDRPFAGNPAAVCLLDAPRDGVWMQNVAREMNLSETAFVVPREDGFDLRWFTPAVEVELCGHATLASAHVLWETGRLRRQRRGAVFDQERLARGSPDRWPH